MTIYILIGLALVAFGMGIGIVLAAILRSDDIPQEPGIRLEDGQGNVHVLHPRARPARLVRPQAW